MHKLTGPFNFREGLVEDFSIDVSLELIRMSITVPSVEGILKKPKTINFELVMPKGIETREQIIPYIREFDGLKLQYKRPETQAVQFTDDAEIEAIKNMPTKIRGKLVPKSRINDKRSIANGMGGDPLDTVKPCTPLVPGHVFKIWFEDRINKRTYAKVSKEKKTTEGYLHCLTIRIPRKEELPKSAQLNIDTSNVKTMKSTPVVKGFPALIKDSVYKLPNGQLFVYPGDEVSTMRQDNAIACVNGHDFIIKYWDKEGVERLFDFSGYSPLSDADRSRLLNSDCPEEKLASIGKPEATSTVGYKSNFKWMAYDDTDNPYIRETIDDYYERALDGGVSWQLATGSKNTVVKRVGGKLVTETQRITVFGCTLFAMCKMVKTLSKVISEQQKDTFGNYKVPEMHNGKPTGKPGTLYSFRDLVQAKIKNNKRLTFNDCPHIPSLAEGLGFMPHQAEALAQIFRLQNATIDMTTGGGKGILAVADILALAGFKDKDGNPRPRIHKALWLMPQNKLMRQQYASVKEYTSGLMNVVMFSSTTLSEMFSEKRWIEVIVQKKKSKRTADDEAVSEEDDTDASEALKLESEASENEDSDDDVPETENKKVKKSFLLRNKFVQYTRALPPNTIIMSTYSAMMRMGQEVAGGKIHYPVPEALIEGGVDYVFMDESHSLKNESAKRTKATQVFASVPWKRIASGTLVAKNPLDAFSQMGILNSTFLGRLPDFQDKYAIMDGGRLLGWKKPKDCGGIAPLSIVRDSIEGNGVSMRRSRWYWLLPKRIMKIHAVHMSKFQQKLYGDVLETAMEAVRGQKGITTGPLFEDYQKHVQKYLDKKKKLEGKDAVIDPEDLEYNSIAWLALFAPIEIFLCNPLGGEDYKLEDDDDFDESNQVLNKKASTVIQAVKARIKEEMDKAPTSEEGISPKVKEINKILDEHFASPNNGKVLIVATHKDSVRGIKNNLGDKYKHIAAPYFSGSINEEKALEEFKDPNSHIKILIATIASIKEGFNFQFANRIISVSIPWSPGDLEQVLSRVYRIGAAAGGGKMLLDTVYVDYVLCDDSFDMMKFGRMVSRAAQNAQVQSNFDPQMITDGNDLPFITANQDQVPQYSTYDSVRLHEKVFQELDTFEHREGQYWASKYPRTKIQSPNIGGKLPGTKLLSGFTPVIQEDRDGKIGVCGELGTESADSWSPLTNEDAKGNPIPNKRPKEKIDVVEILLEKKFKDGKPTGEYGSKEEVIGTVEGPLHHTDIEFVMTPPRMITKTRIGKTDSGKGMRINPEFLKLAPIAVPPLSFSILKLYDDRIALARSDKDSFVGKKKMKELKPISERLHVKDVEKMPRIDMASFDKIRKPGTYWWVENENGRVKYVGSKEKVKEWYKDHGGKRKSYHIKHVSKYKDSGKKKTRPAVGEKYKYSPRVETEKKSVKKEKKYTTIKKIDKVEKKEKSKERDKEALRKQVEPFLVQLGDIGSWALCVDRLEPKIKELKRLGLKYMDDFSGLPFTKIAELEAVLAKLDKAGITYTPKEETLVEEAWDVKRACKKAGVQLKRLTPGATRTRKLLKRWAEAEDFEMLAAGNKKRNLALSIILYDQTLMLCVETADLTKKQQDKMHRVGFKLHRPFYYVQKSPKILTQLIVKMATSKKFTVINLRELSELMRTYVGYTSGYKTLKALADEQER